MKIEKKLEERERGKEGKGEKNENNYDIESLSHRNEGTDRCDRRNNGTDRGRERGIEREINLNYIIIHHSSTSSPS